MCNGACPAHDQDPSQWALAISYTKTAAGGFGQVPSYYAVIRTEQLKSAGFIWLWIAIK
jgi:hypothetical protein